MMYSDTDWDVTLIEVEKKKKKKHWVGIVNATFF